MLNIRGQILMKLSRRYDLSLGISAIYFQHPLHPQPHHDALSSRHLDIPKAHSFSLLLFYLNNIYRELTMFQTLFAVSRSCLQCRVNRCGPRPHETYSVSGKKERNQMSVLRNMKISWL